MVINSYNHELFEALKIDLQKVINFFHGLVLQYY